jgi:microsomal dipeptidase-like Zn-dependent dipeptidase
MSLRAVSIIASLLLLNACGSPEPKVDALAIADSLAPSFLVEPQLNLLPDGRPADVYAMAGGCFGIQNSSDGALLRSVADAATFDGTQADALGFTMKATGLGRYLFYTRDKQFLSIAGDNEAEVEQARENARFSGNQAGGSGDVLVILEPATPVGDGANDAGSGAGDAGAGGGEVAAVNRRLRMTDQPFDGSEWTVDGSSGEFTITNVLTGESLGTAAGLTPNKFDFPPAGQCTPYPEAELNATGTPFSGTNPDGTVFGYAETHMHIAGSEALGGQIGYGRPFHKFGIPHALGDCTLNHGPGGNADALGGANHETQGWPTYADWPSAASQTHHQTYWVWLKRAWMGGLRFMVNHLVANEALCQAWPQKENDCDEMESARHQLKLVEDLQDYIDAQHGGPGKGFLRIVTSPEEARQVIEQGKLAVINGTEMEKVFDCGEYLDQPECTMQEIDERIVEWYDMGLRAIFPIHIFDNAFGGSEISRFTPEIVQVYNAGNVIETGHPFATSPCSEAEALEVSEAGTEDRDLFSLALLQVQNPPPTPFTGCVNNARQLTSLGEYFVNRLIDSGIIIETDHSGPLARKRMIQIALDRGVSVVSGHSHDITLSRDSKPIIQTGGVISNLTDDPVEVTIGFIEDLEAAHLEVFGNTTLLASGFGSDINGIHHQPRPRDDALENPLEYPFLGYKSNVIFDRQRTGERVFDHNIDGVPHYGLYPDYIADMQAAEGGEKALEYVFRSAEAYLRIWEASNVVRDAAAK